MVDNQQVCLVFVRAAKEPYTAVSVEQAQLFKRRPDGDVEIPVRRPDGDVELQDAGEHIHASRQ